MTARTKQLANCMADAEREQLEQGWQVLTVHERRHAAMMTAISLLEVYAPEAPGVSAFIGRVKEWAGDDLCGGRNA